MQQTSKYQFNLVDATDDFSPEPLNQNAQKTETLIAGLETDLAEVIDNLGAGNHTCRLAWGTYTGTGTYGASAPTSVTADFVPVFLLIDRVDQMNDKTLVAVRPMPEVQDSGNSYIPLTWLDNGVQWYSETASMQRNDQWGTYAYLLLGYSAS